MRGDVAAAGLTVENIDGDMLGLSTWLKLELVVDDGGRHTAEGAGAFVTAIGLPTVPMRLGCM